MYLGSQQKVVTFYPALTCVNPHCFIVFCHMPVSFSFTLHPHSLMPIPLIKVKEIVCARFPPVVKEAMLANKQNTVQPLIYDPLMSDHPPFTTTFHVTDDKHTVCPPSSTTTPLTRPVTGSFELLSLTNHCEMNVR